MSSSSIKGSLRGGGDCNKEISHIRKEMFSLLFLVWLRVITSVEFVPWDYSKIQCALHGVCDPIDLGVSPSMPLRIRRGDAFASSMDNSDSEPPTKTEKEKFPTSESDTFDTMSLKVSSERETPSDSVSPKLMGKEMPLASKSDSSDSLPPSVIGKGEPTASKSDLPDFKPHKVRNKRGVLSTIKPKMNRDKDPLLTDALAFIALEELSSCSIIVAFDRGFAGSEALQLLITLPHLQQVLEITTPYDFVNVLWTSPKCRAYFFFFDDPSILLYFMDQAEEPWDYSGKYVLVGFTKSELDILVATKKGKKTEQIIGLVKENQNELKVYMNQLYWGEGTTAVNRWRKGGFTSSNQIFPDKTSDLRGAPIKLITFHFEPHTFIEKSKGSGERRFFGSDVNIAYALSEALNFTLIIEEPPEGEYWGNKSPNGSWSGLTGKVVRNEGHFGLAFIFLTNNFGELDVLEYSRFYSYDTSCFMARTEPPLPRWQSLAAPFKQETWLVALISFLIFCPIIGLLSKTSTQMKPEAQSLRAFAYSSLYTWGVHLRVAQPLIPKRSPTQIWVAILWIYGIVLTTSYSSNLTTFLTVERPRPTMETIKELHSSEMDVLAVGYFFKESLAQSGNAYLKDLVPRYKGLPSYESSFELLEKGEGVLMASNTYLEYLLAASLTQPGIPSVRIMKECFSPYNIAIILQKHFPLKKSFDRVLASLFDQGLMRQWFLDTFSMKKMTRIEDEEKESAEGKEAEVKLKKRGVEIKGGIPLGIDHMQGIFYIFLLGLTLSSIVFLFELY